ncbi:MAG: KTSC domain-containing protein [Allosphingosinicella sp.]
MRVHDFDSSAITRAAYDEAAGTLDIRYKGGDRYRYFEVPAAAFEGLLSAPSAGEYVNRHIKEDYRFEIVGRRRFRPN